MPDPQHCALPALVMPQAWLVPAWTSFHTPLPPPPDETVITALPDVPDQVARIVALPAATPLTTPDAFTLATAGFVDDHKSVAFEIAMLFESFAVALS